MIGDILEAIADVFTSTYLISNSNKPNNNPGCLIIFILVLVLFIVVIVYTIDIKNNKYNQLYLNQQCKVISYTNGYKLYRCLDGLRLGEKQEIADPIIGDKDDSYRSNDRTNLITK